MYIPLHLHTTHSFGDSILTIDGLIDKLKEYKITSSAITNHGTMSDIYEFHEKMINNNLKPILGCEFYMNNNDSTFHLVVIAKNKKGYKNLLYLHNYSQLKGFYKKPLINFEELSSHSDGLIILTACVGGELPKIITDSDESEKEKKIEEFINLYKNTFEDFYLEIQPGNFLEQEVVNEELIKASSKYDVPLVVTNDVHYLLEEDYIAHNIHVAARRKQVSGTDLIYPDRCYYLMEERTLRVLLKNIDENIINEAINNTVAIADMVEVYDIKQGKISMPSFNGLTEEEAGDYIEDECFVKLNEISHSLNDITDYVDRIYYELSVIKTLEFSGYFLIVRDYMNHANKQDIETNAGRGSICASLVAYLLGIHKVDPIKYNLLFERFLSVHRTSPPDIDADFAADRREEMFKYAIEKYGIEHCALVSTFSTRKAKAAIRDTGRVYGHSQDEFDKVAKLIPTVYYQDDEDGNAEKKTDLSIIEAAKIVPELDNYYDNNRGWFNSAIKLSDLPKTTSIHAAGTIISPLVLNDVIPLIRNTNSDMLATSLNLKYAEDVG